VCLETLGGPERGTDGDPEASDGPNTDMRPGRGSARRGQMVRYRQPGTQVGATAQRVPALSAVTLSDTAGQGERAHCRRSVLERSLRCRLLERRRTGRSERLATSDPAVTGVYGFGREACKKVVAGLGGYSLPTTFTVPPGMGRGQRLRSRLGLA